MNQPENTTIIPKNIACCRAMLSGKALLAGASGLQKCVLKPFYDEIHFKNLNSMRK